MCFVSSSTSAVVERGDNHLKLHARNVQNTQTDDEDDDDDGAEASRASKRFERIRMGSKFIIRNIVISLGCRLLAFGFWLVVLESFVVISVNLALKKIYLHDYTL